jgi:hypothetical protein
MLVIREEQIQNFIAEDEPTLVRLIRQIIHELNPERVKDYSDKLVDDMIRIGMGRAKSRELSLAEDIAAFVSVMFEIAPNFDTQKEIDHVFKDENYQPTERFSQLWERVSDEAWKEAEANYDVKIWFPDEK